VTTEGERTPLIRSSFRAHLPGTSHGGFQPSHLTGQNEPSLSGGEKPLLISRVAVGLRNLLFGLGVAFTARKHSTAPWSDKGMPEFLLGCLCNIDHAGSFAPSQPPSFIGMSVERGKRRRW
jgi:hypothetical protein